MLKKAVRVLTIISVATIVTITGTMPVYASVTAIKKISASSNAIFGNGNSIHSDISSDGRYVAFTSSANNLVPGDNNNTDDIFVYDREVDQIEMVYLHGSGTEGNNNSSFPSSSSDGRYIAFESSASNLVEGDTNGYTDIFVYDQDINQVERVSISSAGAQANSYSGAVSISSNGRYVAFQSNATNLVPNDTNGYRDIFVYDRNTDTIERVSLSSSGTQGNNSSSSPNISADGRYVAFVSAATNLVTGDTNGYEDIFVYDRNTDTIERVNLSSGGVQANNNSAGPSISADGRYVAFDSSASNLVPNDTNNKTDVFVYDRNTDTIERVSISSNGAQANNSSNIGYTNSSRISSDGRYVTFSSYASNLVANDTNGTSDVFLYDRNNDTIERVSISTGGTQGNGISIYSSMSSDGRFIVFNSNATNLVTGDTNGFTDVFVHDVLNNTTQRVTITPSGTEGNGASMYGSISSNGAYVAFTSRATNFVPGNVYMHIFVTTVTY